jgi:hypothetical protein
MATIADIIRTSIAEGLNNKQILLAVKAAHPASKTSPACVAFYRSQVKKAGNKLPPRDTERPAKGVYTVKNVKSFLGQEGPGFNATLYKDGVSVAAIIDDASGGPVIFQWHNKADGQFTDVELEGIVYSLVNDTLRLKKIKLIMSKNIAFIGADGKLYATKCNASVSNIKAVNKQHPGSQVLNGLSDEDLLKVAGALV